MLSMWEVFFSDPQNAIIALLLALPGRLLALSVHEYAHAWMADRCGDPTARYMGRLTLNPIKHLSLIGTLMMIFVGVGWAKPVPVNPLKYRNYRRDDLKVSIAGIAMNMLMFIAGSVIMYFIYWAALNSTNLTSGITRSDLMYLFRSVSGLSGIVQYAYGILPYYLFVMLFYFVMTNLALAIFNIIPLPPLDGYHVLNDLVLKKNLFASPQATQYATIILLLLVATNFISKIMNIAMNGITWLTGGIAGTLFSLFLR